MYIRGTVCTHMSEALKSVIVADCDRRFFPPGSFSRVPLAPLHSMNLVRCGIDDRRCEKKLHNLGSTRTNSSDVIRTYVHTYVRAHAHTVGVFAERRVSASRLVLLFKAIYYVSKTQAPSTNYVYSANDGRRSLFGLWFPLVFFFL